MTIELKEVSQKLDMETYSETIFQTFIVLILLYSLPISERALASVQHH